MLPTRMLWTLAFVVVTSLGLSSQSFASECKGMEQAACESTDGCYWVDGYKRKDGVEVSGHCRAKPSRTKSEGDAKDSGDADTQGKKETPASKD